jgi:hypothetical protein
MPFLTSILLLEREGLFRIVTPRADSENQFSSKIVFILFHMHAKQSNVEQKQSWKYSRN